MSATNVQNTGRVYYIEPNDLYNKLPGGIPHPYEDYCISVDLKIEIADRNSLGPIGPIKGAQKTFRYSSDRGTISFIGGTNGFLTTNYTDIQSANAEANTNECLGIESIRICYTSWYVPEVYIRFVDVRGASLMGPQEQGYVNTTRKDLSTGHAGNTSINGGSFFKSLFSFPYPKFKLKVKGFYGKEVTYNLSVEKFESNFNADNGNFETDVKFIGYMFGLYTDIPMNYLMIAPYVRNGGADYWEKQKESGVFKYFGDAVSYYTFPELMAKVKGMNPSMDLIDGTGNDYNEQKNKVEGKIAALTELKELTKEILGTVFDVNYEFCETYNKDKQLIENKKFSLLGVSSKGVISTSGVRYNDIDPSKKVSIDTYNNIELFGEEHHGLKHKIDLFNSKVATYNKTYSDNLSGNNIYFGMSGNKFEVIYVSDDNGNYQFGKKWNQKLFDEGGDKGLLFGSELYSDKDPQTMDYWLKEVLLQKNIISKSKLVFCYPGQNRNVIPDWIGDIDDRLSKLNTELTKILEQEQSQRNTNLSMNLGFGVSVGNIFRMSFAHMETFMNIFYNYLRKIKEQQEQGNRSLDKINISLGNTDLPSNFKSSSQIPPFTMFYKDLENGGDGVSNINKTTGKKKVALWPGKIDGIDKSALPEIDFVNSLIQASKQYANYITLLENLDKANREAKEKAGTDLFYYIPLTPFDFSHEGTQNPYAYLSTLSNGNMQWECMMNTFCLRFIYWYSTRTESLSSDDIQTFAKIDAYNVFKAHPTILPAIKEFIKNRKGLSSEKVGSEIADYFCKDSTIENPKCYDVGRGTNTHFLLSGNTYQYDWSKDGYYLIANIPPNMADFIHGDTDNYVPIRIAGTHSYTGEFVTDDNKKIDAFEKYLNLIESDIISDISPRGYKDCYREKILPTSEEVPSYEMGYGNKLSDRAKEATYLVSDAGIFKGYTNTEFPKSKDDMDRTWVNSPSFIVKDSKYTTPLYGTRAFYDEFNKITDEDIRLYSKACAFALGLPVLKTEKVDRFTNPIPYYLALKIGAIKFLAIDDSKIVEIRNHVSNVTDTEQEIKASISAENQEACLSMFREWVERDFTEINNAYELNISVEGFDKVISSCKESKEKKLGNILQNYNTEIYDPNGEICLTPDGSIYLPTKKGSDVEEALLNKCNSYIMFYEPEKFKSTKLTIPRDRFSNAMFDFFKGVSDIYSEQIENDQISSSITEEIYDPERDEDLKISTYLTLKSLYDRWIASVTTENKWKLNGGEESEFSHFKFIDGFYRNIEASIAVNMDHVIDLASQSFSSTNINDSATGTKYAGKSLYEFLTEICQKNGMTMLALPMENEFTNPKGIYDMFDVKPYSQMDSRDTSCFVCLYTNKPSQYLDINYDNEEYLYATDGFNLANARGQILNKTEIIPQLVDTTIDGYDIPSFGVTYGKQNQSIFKKISVGMQNPQVTEASIAATQLIASKDNEGPTRTALYGQDLYRVYANYSYTCSVEMLGNAQIMPLTYFQLNNIPLFKGAYMIINMEHNITAGDMTTKFTGVRMSRYELPLVSDSAFFNDPWILTNYGSMFTGLSAEDLNNIKVFFDSSAVTGERKYTIEKRNFVKSSIPTTEVSTSLDGLLMYVQNIQDAWSYYCSQNQDKSWAKYDKVTVTSGYRSPEHNREIGGATNSAHMYGYAADMQVSHLGTVDLTATMVFGQFVADVFGNGNIPFDQILVEKNTAGKRWLHFAYRRYNGEQRNYIDRNYTAR